jgi:hypothetical protein
MFFKWTYQACLYNNDIHVLGTSQLWTWITNKTQINWYVICIFILNIHMTFYLKWEKQINKESSRSGACLCLTMLRNCFIGEHIVMHNSYHLWTTQNKEFINFLKALSNLTYAYFLVGPLCMCLCSILQNFVPCIIGFGTLFQIQSKNLSLIWKLDLVW